MSNPVANSVRPYRPTAASQVAVIGLIVAASLALNATISMLAAWNSTIHWSNVETRTWAESAAIEPLSSGDLSRVAREVKPAAQTFADNPDHLHQLKRQYGWPLRSFEVVIVVCQSAPDEATILQAFANNPHDPWGILVRGAWPKPARDVISILDTPQWLPLRPVPFGFFGNTLLYACTVWLAVRGAGQVRRLIRRSRRCCVNCGYDLRGTPSNVCSECGGEVLSAQGQ